MPRELNADHLERLEECGYLIIPEYYAGQQLKEMQAAQRRTLPIWEKVKDNPPANRAILTEFPPAEMVLPHGIVDHHAWDFSRKWLRTNQIHFQAGCMIARYPGFKDGVWVVMSPDSTWIMEATHYYRTLISVVLMTPTLMIRYQNCL